MLRQTRRKFLKTAGAAGICISSVLANTNNGKLLCYEPLDKDALSRCVTNEKIPRHITQAWGAFKVAKKPLWNYDCPDSIAVAMTRNAVVVANSSKVAAIELSSGRPLWSENLPSAPVPWGMAVDRNGRVVMSLVDGRVLCIGRKELFGQKIAGGNW